MPPSSPPADGPSAENATVTPEALRRVAPYSRHAWMQGRALFRPLRQELVHQPVGTIEAPDLKLRKCIEMAAAFTDPQFTDRLCRRLSERFGAGRVLPSWLEALAHQRRFDDAFRWASDAAAQDPGDLQAQLRRARYAMMAGRPRIALDLWRETLPRVAEEAPAQLSEIVPTLVEAGDAAWLRDHFPQIAARRNVVGRALSLSPPAGDLPIYCVTLEKDHRRMNGTRPFLAPGGQLTEVPALLGNTVPRGAAARLTAGNPALITPAELGCSLSHLSVWERIARDCAPQDYALVVEDDSRFIYGPGRGTQEIIAAARRRDAGFVFVNLRACWEAHQARGEGPVEVLPIGHRFDPDLPEEAPRNPGWGTDGYLITGAVARDLCRIWPEVGVMGAIDWQLNMMSYDRLRPWQDRKITRNIYNALSARGDWPRIPGHVCTLPILTERDFGFSTINAVS